MYTTSIHIKISILYIRKILFQLLYLSINFRALPFPVVIAISEVLLLDFNQIFTGYKIKNYKKAHYKNFFSQKGLLKSNTTQMVQYRYL